MAKILIIEDEKSLNDSLKEILEKEEYIVESAYTFEEAENKITKDFDIFLIDINLGYKSGFKLYEKIKDIKKDKLEEIVCIFLTARDSIKDNIAGLDLGIDDYITKPFNASILLSKIRNLYKKKKKDTVIFANDFKLDILKKALYYLDEEITLTFLEYEIMEKLFNNKNIIISREELKDLIYEKTENYVNDNTISVYIKRIRKKIEEKGKDNLIESVRGFGYRING